MDQKIEEIRKMTQLAKTALSDARTELRSRPRALSVEEKEEQNFDRMILQFDRYVFHVDRGAINDDLVEEADKLEKSVEKLPYEQRETAFKCVSSYKTCKAESASLEDKIDGPVKSHRQISARNNNK